jgi:hypothetical protein
MVIEMQIILAEAFSRYPAGRSPKDGPDNGIRFRQEFLVPALTKALQDPDGKVQVVLDGVRSFGSSFLEEAFGGLIRAEGFKRSDVERLIEIIAERPVYQTYKRLIQRYIREAKPL